MLLFTLCIAASLYCSAGRGGTTVCCNPYRCKTNYSYFCSTLFRTKSTCLALFSNLRRAQLCDGRIHFEVNFGEQPFPENSVSLNVSLPPIGFYQKAIFMYLGQLNVTVESGLCKRLNYPLLVFF